MEKQLFLLNVSPSEKKDYCHFPIGILGQVWYLIVSISDLCTLHYFHYYYYYYHYNNKKYYYYPN